MATAPCGMVIEPVARNLPVFGSYSAAVTRVPELFHPPAIKTVSLGSRVAVWAQRAVGICPVGLANFPGGSLDLAADSLLTFVLGGQWLADSRH